jgi:hypothetical protein
MINLCDEFTAAAASCLRSRLQVSLSFSSACSALLSFRACLSSSLGENLRSKLCIHHETSNRHSIVIRDNLNDCEDMLSSVHSCTELILRSYRIEADIVGMTCPNEDWACCSFGNVMLVNFWTVTDRVCRFCTSS